MVSLSDISSHRGLTVHEAYQHRFISVLSVTLKDMYKMLVKYSVICGIHMSALIENIYDSVCMIHFRITFNGIYGGTWTNIYFVLEWCITVITNSDN